MTTVINYNFFGFNLDSIFGDFALKNRHSEKRRNYSPNDERVIDITAQSRVLDSDENSIEINLDKTLLAARLSDLSMINITYDRKGKIVRHFDSTGLHVDSYV